MTDRKYRNASSSVHKSTLEEILQNQKQILDEVQEMKRQLDTAIQNAKVVQGDMSREISELTVNSTDQVRRIDTKVLGLTAVLDNVQDRIIHLELDEHVSPTYHISTSSLSSTDEESGETTRSSELSNTGGRRTDQTRLDQICKQPEEKPPNNQKWLRENHLLLVKGIDTKCCLLLDYLLQDEIISETDEEDISSHLTRKDKTRELLFKMRHADKDKIEIFVKHIKTDFPHLVQNFSKDNETGEDSVDVCIACDVVKQVNIGDVIDVLYQHAIVDDDLYEEIWRNSTQRKGWSRLLKHVDHTRMPKCLSVLTQALAQKYPQICQRLSQSGIRSLACCCCKRQTVSPIICSERSERATSYKVCTRLKSPARILSCRRNRFTELYGRYCRSQKRRASAWGDKK